MIPTFELDEGKAPVVAENTGADGFEDDAFIALYANRTLEDIYDYDIINLVAGRIQRRAEQPAIAMVDGEPRDAVLLMRKRNPDGLWPVYPRYYALLCLPEDVDVTNKGLDARNYGTEYLPIEEEVCESTT